MRESIRNPKFEIEKCPMLEQFARPQSHFQKST
jgi:hypothetical protein